MFLKSLLYLPLVLVSVAAKLQTYPIPDGIDKSTAFDVKVRQGRSGWKSLDVYAINLHEINTTTGNAALRASSVSYFDFTDTVEISVKYNNAARAKSVRVRPDSYGIEPKLKKSTATFKISKPQNIVVQFDDEVFDVLHLFGGDIEKNVPSEDDDDVMYYGPGVHGKTGEIIEVSKGKTVYLTGGAVLKSSLQINGTSDVTVRGRGIIYMPSNGLNIAFSTNTVIDGIMLINSNLNSGNNKGVHVKNVKSFSGTQYGDGMDYYCSQDVLAEGVFFRNSDDCMAIYGYRETDFATWSGDSSNITLRDSTLWADVAHPLNIGTHGNTKDPETLSGINYKNIDILDHREAQVDYQGCIALNPGDSNFVQNVQIEDIRVEDFRIGQLINMRVMYNEKYNTSPGRGIENVTIKNLDYKGTHANMAIFVGYDEDRLIKGVQFEGLKINGKLISDTMTKPGWYKTTDFMPAFFNEHVKNITFV